ncbi:hypothetical protein JL721_10126 [Aureococcus anophagefferens]|nr:hypothetical protein JL721_10126 [Aureococcus anophagefferens]
MAVVSDDHAQAHLCVENVGADGLRLFSPAEIKRNDGRDGRAFWAVVDGFVVDATAFVDSHPGGLRKLLSTDDANTGATGKAFGFSLSKGRNAHFPQTGQRFHDGVRAFLGGGSNVVKFHGGGSVAILGKLAR